MKKNSEKSTYQLVSGVNTNSLVENSLEYNFNSHIEILKFGIPTLMNMTNTCSCVFCYFQVIFKYIASVQ